MANQAQPSDHPPRRFRVALSFPGSKRPFAKQVAELLADKLGKERVFYDNWYLAEKSSPAFDDHLTDIYRREADLVVTFISTDYTNLEWRAIHDLLFSNEKGRIMPFRFDHEELPLNFRADGCVLIKERVASSSAHSDQTVTSRDVAKLILERLSFSPSEEIGKDALIAEEDGPKWAPKRHNLRKSMVRLWNKLRSGHKGDPHRRIDQKEIEERIDLVDRETAIPLEQYTLSLWTESDNDERCALILKELHVGLTQEEEAKLESLQRRQLEWIREKGRIDFSRVDQALSKYESSSEGGTNT